MNKTRFGTAIGVWLIIMVAGCAAPATPVPAPIATAVPPTAQVIAVGFTPAVVCSVPNVVGLGQSAAQGMLVKLGLQPVLANQYDVAIAEGAVISQKPAAGTQMKPCTGSVDIVVSLGPLPTLTPRPATATPRATATPEATATPADTATPAPTPTPSNRLFYDNFVDGVKPEWHWSGADVRTVNDDLVIKGAAETALDLGSLTDFSIELGMLRWGGPVRIHIREQDRDNYMMLVASTACQIATCWPTLGWFVVRDGKETPIPSTELGVGQPDKLRIEVQGNVYRTIVNGEPKLRFTDQNFKQGGVNLQIVDSGGQVTMRSFEIRSMP